ncbi:MAG: FAD-dependent oxidoreductase [Pseudomonadota bacterium]
MKFPLLFSPFTLKNVELRNRVAMPPFGLNFTGMKRVPNDRLIDFYEERARGGAGLLIVGGAGIDLRGSGFLLPGIDSDDTIPHWARLTEAVHRHGAKVFIQLFHSGRYSHLRLNKGQQPVAPSAVTSRLTGEEPRALERDEILEIEALFAQAARRAREAGADGVEILSSAGYLICQFLSPLTNLREDEYGGSFENRCRFGVETLGAVRAAVGDEFPVTLRYSGNDFMPGSNTSRELIDVAKRFEAAGADGFNVTGGWHETPVPQLPAVVPRGAYSYLAAGIRQAVGVPVFASNRITRPEHAEALLRDGVCDLVSVGRSLIADPEWPNKARTGRTREIRPCVACLQGCLDKLFSLGQVTCLCNPRAGFEGTRNVTPAETEKHVVVIGAGPAGLEAALTALDRGHRVTVLEKADHIGGQLLLAAAPPGRSDFGSLLDYYVHQVGLRGVDVRLGVEATVETIRALSPDSVILATGAQELIPDIPGAEHAVHAWDVLQGQAATGRRVVVVGGGAVGIETALYVAEKGCIDGETLKFLMKYQAEDVETLRRLVTRGTSQVCVVEMLAKVGADIGPANRWVFLKELELMGVDVRTGARVVGITADSVEIETEDGRARLDTDTVILALGVRAQGALGDALEAAGIPVIRVGDAKKPRQILHAVHEGFEAARGI